MADAPARILAVTDLSESGDVALLEAARQAQATGATLGISHAIPSIESIRPLFPQELAHDAVLASQLPMQAQAAVERRLDALGITSAFELFVESGTTADVALKFIDRWHPTLVVLGSPADGAVGTINIVRHASSPVLIARTSPQTKRVVVGTDFSDSSYPAVELAAKTAAGLEGELVVVHAIEQNPVVIYGVVIPTVTPSNSVEHYETAERRLGAVLTRLGVQATPRIVVGPPAPALVDTATTVDATLLVVGTHGRTGLTRFLLGSVAEAVIHRAPCSVLVARLA